MEDFDDDDDELLTPTMRGTANLDAQDYAHPDDGPDTFLDGELQEEIESTPGSGAAPATDVVGTEEFEMAEDDDDGPGMRQTTYGNHPFGPGDGGSGSGYRPMSMQMTDMPDLSGAPEANAMQQQESRQVDAMVRAGDAEEVLEPFASDDDQFNSEPSNAAVDPETLYDRTSYEYSDDPNDTIGAGIFDMEEGVTFNARDGSFANQYAQPSYLVDEGEMDTQQSEMWDSTANNWRVTQPSGGGVTFMTEVDRLKSRTYSPFASEKGGQLPEMRQEVTGPRSHIEAFGRRAAKCLIAEAKCYPPPQRSRFLVAASEALGPQVAQRARSVADRLVQYGYAPEQALENTLAHSIMHATMRDLADRPKVGTLPRLDRMAANVKANGAQLRAAASEHLVPLTADAGKLQSDLGRFYHSPAAAGVGEVTAEPGTAEAGAPATAPLLSVRNLAIGAAVVGAGYLFFSKTETGQEITANARRAWKKAMRKQRRAKRRSR